jgi:hypothetical protein
VQSTGFGTIPPLVTTSDDSDTHNLRSESGLSHRELDAFKPHKLNQPWLSEGILTIGP